MGSKKTKQREAHRAEWKKAGAEIQKATPNRVVIEVDRAAVIPKKKLEQLRKKNARESNEHKSIHRILMPAHGGANKPMQCRMIGCNNRLRYRQLDIVCSPYCRRELKKLCETYLEILNGTMLPEQLPYYYRTRGSARFIPPRELDTEDQEKNHNESRAEQARRLRQDGNPSRWHSDMHGLRAAAASSQQLAREVRLPDCSDPEEGE